ncbi:DUF499 domain-containing protein [Schaalia cardiffensis]|uniref:DUF499 domain-containing protein n=1 Tax=Schaalia cardiffensis TaxID=181487 RepID=UPI0018E81F98|nr:DUF499 domain-containing protein [Schaalia cardiffensis]MBJ2329795.1 DUF499 domain-containing protein [Schaalia cardiffensis]
MASPSNRHSVGEGLDLLAESLGPWISRTLNGRIPAETPWEDLLAAKDGITGKTYDPGDLHCQLRIVTEHMGDLGFLFNDSLSRAEQNLAQELRDVRNAWAHGVQFSSDDAYRALDTVERLLKAINAPEAAVRARKTRVDIQRRTYDAAARRDSREAAVAMPGLGEEGLTPWKDVVRPHADILSGDFGQAEYAADLYQVAHGQGGAEYRDPVRFFERTYLTQGLKTLLTISANRLSGDGNAQPIVNLQTTFGGGKTHSMLAAWHLAGGTPLHDLPQDLQDLLGDRELPATIRRVAIVGNEISPGQPMRKADGTVVRTLWGELAWQLGGAVGYAFVAEADRTGTNPGSALRSLIAEYSPALILIDEWVAYARGLFNREDEHLPGGSFDDQFSFAQTLAEAVKAVPGALLLVSIPASDIRADGTPTKAFELEIGGTGGREALARLQHIVSRVAYNWSPASSGESFEIVRRRLFTDLDADAIRRREATVRRFSEYYRAQPGELPSETIQVDYEQRLREAYPIHPELFDRLYNDWSSLERFQRTRGVLRLMSAVVHSLVESCDDSPLIMPGSIPLDDAVVRDEICGYLDDSWRSIIESDVDGQASTPLRIDKERALYGRRALTRRIARALFLGSAAATDDAHKGVGRARLFLGVAMPGDTLGNFGSALQLLTDNATYVYNEAGRSWYDRRASINRLVGDRARSYSDADVRRAAIEMIERLAGRSPEFVKNLIAPSSTGDVPDEQEVRLVILGPELTVSGKNRSVSGPGRDFTDEMLRKRSSAPRVHANTIIAVAPDASKWADAEHALRTHMAWSEMSGQGAVRTHDLTHSQAEQAKAKALETRAAAERAVSAAWVWALHPEQDDGTRPFTVRGTRIDGDESRIAVRAGAKLGRQDQILTHCSASSIALDLQGTNLRARWNRGWITVSELWSLYTRYPYMKRLRDERVLRSAVASVMADIGWHSVGFALASGYDERTGDFEDLRIPLEDDEPEIISATVLVAPPLAQAQRRREKEEHENASGIPPALLSLLPSDTGDDDSGLEPPTERPEAPVNENTYYRGRIDLDPGKGIETQLITLVEEIIERIVQADADSLEIGVNIEARKYAGFPEATVRAVTENSRTLGLTPGRFTGD